MFSKSYVNKLVSYADKYFTWDWRKMKRDNTTSNFDFIAMNNDTKAVVVISTMRSGLWLRIEKGDRTLVSKFAKSYAEVREFKTLIYALG